MGERDGLELYCFLMQWDRDRDRIWEEVDTRVYICGCSCKEGGEGRELIELTLVKILLCV